jgi:RNA polymerase sigma-70 factor, ECF subfamily
MNENHNESDYQAMMSPHLELLLRLALSLTKNGQDALALLRDTIAESSRSWRDSTRTREFDSRAFEILTKRFFNEFRPEDIHAVPDHESIRSMRTGEERIRRASVERFACEPIVSEKHMAFYRAIAGLPEQFRLAMFLSFVEGFSIAEIAATTGKQGYLIESLLIRGCGLVKTELQGLVMGDYQVTSEANREARSA